MKQLYLFIAALFIASSSYSNTSLLELDCDIVVNTPATNDVYICNGSATLSVSATGSMLTYQWFYGGLAVNINSNTFSATEPGDYECVITGVSCFEAVSFTVLQGTTPIIVSEPTSTTLCQGEVLFLSISATGENITYQWFHNDQPIIGADSSIWIIIGVGQFDSGDYYCRVSSGCSVNSAVAQISINYVAITNAPISFVGCDGSAFIAYLEAEGNALSYQLYHNDQPIEGVTSNMQIITVGEDTIGHYTWMVSTPSCPVHITNFDIFMAPNATIEGETNQSFISGQTLADLEVSGGVIKWSNTEQINFQDLLPSTTPLVDGTTYYAFTEGVESLCMSDVLKITVHLELSINDLNKLAFQYYPNPVKNVLNFKAESFINTIQVYNMLGQAVIKKNIHNQSGVLDMDALPQGQYILKINTLEAEENFKIVKE